MPSSPKTLIIALGNPGKEYENTYHNAGVLALDALVDVFAKGETPEWHVYKKLFSYAEMNDAVFIKTLTFMNESGKAVKEAIKKFHTKPKDITLIHDDSDITIGEMKMSFARNAAGHHGVESVIAAIRSNEFMRARIGIRPAHEAMRKKASAFVLSPVSAPNKKILDGVFMRLADEVKAFQKK